MSSSQLHMHYSMKTCIQSVILNANSIIHSCRMLRLHQMGHSFLYRMMRRTISLVITPNTLPTNMNRHWVMTMTLRCPPAGRIVMPVVCLHLQKMMSQYNHVILAECVEYLLTWGISMESHGTPLIFLGTLSSVTLGAGLGVKCQVALRPDPSPGMNRFLDLVLHLPLQGLVMTLLSLPQNHGPHGTPPLQSPLAAVMRRKTLTTQGRNLPVVVRKRWQIYTRKEKYTSSTTCSQEQYHQRLMTSLATLMSESGHSVILCDNHTLHVRNGNSLAKKN